jgi:hypothetical protein
LCAEALWICVNASAWVRVETVVGVDVGVRDVAGKAIAGAQAATSRSANASNSGFTTPNLGAIVAHLQR